ncbi:hypothetical protein ACVWZV_009111 [Bradyrhizobium sp. GM5.1]
MTSAAIIVPSASIPARQNRSKLARTSANASSTAPVAGEPAGVISLVMNLFRNSTEPGTSPTSNGNTAGSSGRAIIGLGQPGDARIICVGRPRRSNRCSITVRCYLTSARDQPSLVWNCSKTSVNGLLWPKSRNRTKPNTEAIGSRIRTKGQIRAYKLWRVASSLRLAYQQLLGHAFTSNLAGSEAVRRAGRSREGLTKVGPNEARIIVWRADIAKRYSLASLQICDLVCVLSCFPRSNCGPMP